MLGKIIGNSIVRNFKLDRNKLHNNLFLLKSYANSTDAKTNNNLIRHNFHAECKEGINHQINQEFCVSYVYLYMSSIFSTADVALHGFANYFREAAHEELKHGQMLIEYLNQRGGKLVLKEIGAPEKKDWSNPICAVQCSIDLEKQVTQNDKKEELLIFKIKLEKLKKHNVKLPQCSSSVEIPSFLVQVCSFIEDNITIEGLFRKAGSSSRQKELKNKLEDGLVLDSETPYHVIDVANILKLFLRELPESLIPFKYHDTFLRCLTLKEKKIDALLLTCLLLPLDYLNSLAFLLNFLKKVALNCDKNKMDVSNLAIILTPNIMPVNPPKITPRGTLRINHHVQVIKILIENAALIGVVPDCISEHLCLCHPSLSASSHDELDSFHSKKKKKKKRRSGSLTRMLNGLKKIVGGKGSPEESNAITSTPEQTSALHTPRIMSTGKKRKAPDISYIAPLSAKKKKEVIRLLPHGTILADSYAPTHLTPRIVVAQQIPRKSKSPTQKSKSRFFASKYSSDSGLCKPKKSCSTSRLRITRLSISGRKSKKKTEYEDSGLDSSLAMTQDLSMNKTNLSDEYVRISKKEYEAIKSRVSEIESRISHEFQNIRGVSISDIEDSLDSSKPEIKNIQTAYEKTLEESEKINNSCTEDLARRLRRDLKIRRSIDSCIIRSPSARKIGTLRRRSKESSPLLNRNFSLNTSDRPEFKITHFYPSKSLRRGKPNTVYTGLPQPSPLYSSDSIQNSESHFIKKVGLSSSENFYFDQNTSLDINDLDFGVLTRSRSIKRSSFQEQSRNNHIQSPLRKTNSFNFFKHSTASPRNIEWESAESFLLHDSGKDSKLTYTGRPSIAKIRTQNAGMVLAKAKMFDSVIDHEKNSKNETTSDNENEYNYKLNNPGEQKPGRKVQDIKKNSSFTKNKDLPCYVNLPILNRHISPKKSHMKKTELNKSQMSQAIAQHSKENTHPDINFKTRRTTALKSKISNYCEIVTLPDGLKDTIYDVCTPLSEKSVQLVSPLKDSNRCKLKSSVNKTPPIKKLLATPRSSHLSPLKASGYRGCKKPIKAVGQVLTPRRSPRQLKSRTVKQLT